ncbi:MAG TPA: DUF4185 domain-containing protein, partial [Elusimicrobiales bacterium]|nr:DUF4185 domain-containing protein [Elusimicrobiales bacterium]
FSLPLDGERTLWLFGDTWVGKVRDGKHADSRIVNNSIALQHGRLVPGAKLDFHYRLIKGEPAAFISPEDGRGLFWLDHGGVLTGKGLFLVMNRIEKPHTDGPALDFRSTGLTMAHISNPEDHPLKWKTTLRDVPWVRVPPGGNEVAFGHPLLKAGGMVYIYGTETDAKRGERYLLAARVPEDRFEDFTAWTFYSGGKWLPDPAGASRLADRFGPEFSVSYQPALRRYVAVYTESGLSSRIMLRTAPAPEGPWSAPIKIYECPEYGWNPDYFCYAAKGHPGLSSGEDELLVSYVCNSHDFWNMAADARIYRPRFLKVKFRK